MLASMLFLATLTPAQSLVHDLDTRKLLTDSSQPRDFLTLEDGRALFNAAPFSSGRQFWFTGGTPESTEAALDSDPLTGFPGAVVTLLLPNGTALIQQQPFNELLRVAPGAPQVEVVANFTAFDLIGLSPRGSGALMLVTANGGCELWQSDGSAAGTQSLGAVAGTCSSIDLGVQAGDLLFFRGSESSTESLWVSDGTAAGTVPLLMAKDIDDLVALGDLVFFAVIPDSQSLREFWQSDGTPAGTNRLDGFNFVGPTYVAADSYVAFAGSTSAGLEPWRTDGTPTGTYTIEDLGAGSSGSSPRFLASDGDSVLMSTSHNGAADLWITDGTALGTMEVTPGVTATGEGVGVGGEFYVRSTVGGTFGNPFQLARVSLDGVSTPIELIGSVGAPGHSPQFMTPYEGGMLFSASTSINGREPWRVEQGADTAFLLRDIAQEPFSSAPHDLAKLGNRLVFTARSSDGDETLYSTEGEGEPLPLDIGSGQVVGAFGSGLILIVERQSGDNELVYTDGTSVNALGGPTINSAGAGVEFAGSFYVGATTSLGRVLLRYGDSDVGSDPEVLNTGDRVIDRTLAVGGSLYLRTAPLTIDSGFHMYRIDAIDPSNVLDPFPTLDPRSNFVERDGGVFCFGEDAGLPQRAIYRVDGPLPTVIHATSASNFARTIYALEDGFLLQTGSGAVESVNDQGLVLLSFFASQIFPVGGNQAILVRADYALSFDDFHSSTTFLGALGTEASDLTQIGTDNDFAFSAVDGTHGREPWIADLDTLPGSHFGDVNDGLAGSDPLEFVRVGTRVYFSATNPSVGRELFAFDLTDADAWVAESYGSPCGTSSLPKIGVDGEAVAGEQVTLSLTDAAPNAAAFLVAGSEVAQVDLGGGCIQYVGGPLNLVPLVTDSLGSIVLPTLLPASFVGHQITLQFAVSVPGGAVAGAFDVSPGFEVITGI